MELTNTSAVITGGGNGIGRAIALALADQGVNVGIGDLEKGAAMEVAAEVREQGVSAFGLEVDVMNENDLKELADEAWRQFGSVQLLFNNAGIVLPPKPVIETTKAEYDWCFGVNVEGVMNGMRVFGPKFVASDRPCWIVNTGSEHSLGVPHSHRALYTATKHAVLGLSDVARRELPDHVGVSVLCPGVTDSSIWRAGERRPERLGGAEKADERFGVGMALGMPAEDVARCVIEAIQDEDFYIVTHAHVIEYPCGRWAEIESAFKKQSPRYDGDDQYTMEGILARMKASN